MTRLLQVQEAFDQIKNPQEAQKMSAYLHHQFTFYGVRTPERRQLYKAIIADDKKSGIIDWNLLAKAWDNPYREFDYLVCDYLRARATELTANDLPRLLPFLTSKQWWETIDSFAPTLGKMAEQDKQVEQQLLSWASSDDIWLRRIAIIHQLGRKSNTNADLLAQIILTNLGSKEFFINKAIGWALRDYSKSNPAWVKNFVNQHFDQLAPLSIKEGSKYL